VPPLQPKGKRPKSSYIVPLTLNRIRRKLFNLNSKEN
jgi:hypothetical protein